MDKLFVIVDARLRSGLKMAQACHAMRLFADEHAELERRWYTESSNIVILEHDELVGIARDLGSLGYAISHFHEPDLDDALTAVCVEPRAGRHLSTMKLAS